MLRHLRQSVTRALGDSILASVSSAYASGYVLPLFLVAGSPSVRYGGGTVGLLGKESLYLDTLRQ